MLVLRFVVVACCCCCMLLLHVVACCCCMLLLLHVVVACCCCMLLLHVVVACCCCMLLLHVVVACCCCSSTYSHFFRITSNSTYTKSALSYCGPLLWNSLPLNLTSITSLLSFRKALKTMLFKQFVAERSGTVWNQCYINDKIRLD